VAKRRVSRTGSVFPARTVLFDWDGTLIDSARADTRAYLAMFAALGISWTTRELERHYHPDWYRVYQAARIHRSRWKEADRLWRTAYALEKPMLLTGVRDVLRELRKRFVLGIVTSGDGGRVRPQLRSLRIESYFSVCVCSEDAPRRKPHPAPLQLALRALGAKPDEAIYVGDSPQDMEMARRARVRAIGVLGPFPTAKNLRAARPELLLGSVRELPPYVKPIR
jgi:HAD superfamily hydrolase (TIGR01509 family)